MRVTGVIFLLVLFGPGGAVPTLAQDRERQQEQKKEQPPGQPDRKSSPKPARPAPARRPAGPEPPPLRFDDFDLEKYHAPAPGEEETPDREDQDQEAAAGQAPGSGTAVSAPGRSGARVAPPRRAAAPRAPKPPPAPSRGDPLKTFRDREATETFRADQLQRARERIAGLQSRLDYLQAKKNAIQNPAPVLAGQTRGPDRTPTPIQGPGKVAIGGFFPNLPPPQTDQDKENDRKMKTRDLLALVEEEIKGLEGELEQAQAELISIQTRFAQETGGQ
jgi:hypothetical protein